MQHYTKSLAQFPTQPGALLFPVSLSKVLGDQSPEKLKETLYDLHPKVRKPGVSASFIFGDALYQQFDGNYQKRQNITENTCQALINELSAVPDEKIPLDMSYVQFLTRSQMRLFAQLNIHKHFCILQELYDKDTQFQAYMKADCEGFGRELTDAQRDFFLEEHLLMTLIAKNKVKIHQQHVPDPRWQLRCYPGAPLRHQVYMIQKGLVGGPYDTKNRHQAYEYSRYDHKQKLLYDMTKINVDYYEAE